MKKTFIIALIGAAVFMLGALSATFIRSASAETPAVVKMVQVNSDGSSLSFRDLAKKVTPAVVHISAETVTKSQTMFPFNDPFFKDFFNLPDQIENRNTSLGTGFIFNKDGYIVTNNHVIRNAKTIAVTLPDGREFSEDVEIIGVDERTDMAVLRIKTDEELPFLNFGDSDDIEVGDWVMAVGNPFGFDNSVTVGVVSAKNRSNLNMQGAPVYQDFIQTDASINPGNSGGPLVDINGNVIGINTAIASPSGGNVGIGFAVPSSIAYSVVSQLIDKGSVTRGYLGIFPQELTQDLKDKFGVPADRKGILVAQVEKDTPADKGGLKEGDVILSFDGNETDNVNKFRIIVAETPVNKNVEVVILRDRKEKKLNIKIGTLEEAAVADNDEPAKSDKWLGIDVADAKQYKDKYGYDTDNGAVILSIENDSPVRKAGLQQGDVIVKIEEKEIKSIKDYNDAYKKFKDKDDILLTVKRGRVNIWVVVKNK